jgi:chromosome segregation ATPase
VEEKQRVELELQELQSQLKLLRSKEDAETPIRVQLEADIANLVVEITALNKEQATLQSDIRSLKNHNNECADKLNTLKFQMMNLRQEIAKLNSQIVHSPEKTKKMIEDMKVSLGKEKELLMEVEQRGEDLQERAEILAKVEKEVTRNTKLLDECEQERSRSKAQRKNLKSSKTTLMEKENLLRELNSNDQIVKRQVQAMQDKVERLAKLEEDKTSAAEEAIAEAHKDRMDAERKRAATQGSVDKNTLSVHQIQQRMEALKRQHEAEMEVMRSKYDQLEQQVRTYHKNMFQAIKSM